MRITTLEVLERLESFYGPQEPYWPTDPYHFLIWWNCGYPQSDRACAKGWESLRKNIGVEPDAILAASIAELARAVAPGGMVPEKRAQRLQEIAARVRDECGGDLRGRISGSPDEARKFLKKFPTIADPGADRILLFGGISPIAAVPSNCPYVLVRIQRGREHENYGATYREAQALLESEVGRSFSARQRAYVLLKKHGQETCKTAKPRCEQCPVNSHCALFAGSSRGRATLGGVSP